jgi:hypothetical protein
MSTSFVSRLVVPALIAGLAFTVLAQACQPAKSSKSKTGDKQILAYRFSGPYTQDNLTIYLIHGDDQLKDKEILTLDEALKAKQVIVHETQNVNQLAIENVSGCSVFVQAGDIVRGGQQDRTIAFDMLVPPNSGKVPLNAFCVEAGRWTQRGKEAKGYFNGSANCVVGNDLNFAVRKAASQNAVWDNVAKKQMDLQSKVKADVQARESKSSLELTLEHKTVVEAVDRYIKKLQDALKDKNDVIGYAVVINGKVNNADVYASHTLFAKMWPKLLKASAVEAVSAIQKDKKFEPAKVEAVQAFLADSAKGKKTEKKIGERFQQIEQESDKSILFETKDHKNNDVSLRRSHLAK